MTARASMVLVFALGALLLAALVALLRASLTKLLERRGHRLDRWRRVWFHSERELVVFLEAILIVAFVTAFVRSYRLPAWVLPLLVGLWALHLPADLWSWLRLRRRPHNTRWLHERGFLLLDLGPLWLRGVVVLLASASYLLIAPLRSALDIMMGFMLDNLQGWFS